MPTVPARYSKKPDIRTIITEDGWIFTLFSFDFNFTNIRLYSSDILQKLGRGNLSIKTCQYWGCPLANHLHASYPTLLIVLSSDGSSEYEEHMCSSVQWIRQFDLSSRLMSTWTNDLNKSNYLIQSASSRRVLSCQPWLHTTYLIPPDFLIFL